MIDVSAWLNSLAKALCDINGSVGIYSSRLPVRSIIFLGAPHKGLETTALETLVKSQATEDMIRELKSESPTLTELNDKFRHVAQDIDILTCYELSPTKTAIEVQYRLITQNVGSSLKVYRCLMDLGNAKVRP